MFRGVPDELDESEQLASGPLVWDAMMAHNRGTTSGT
jgi:hypothetical protein